MKIVLNKGHATFSENNSHEKHHAIIVTKFRVVKTSWPTHACSHFLWEILPSTHTFVLSPLLFV